MTTSAMKLSTMVALGALTLLGLTKPSTKVTIPTPRTNLTPVSILLNHLLAPRGPLTLNSRL